MPENFPDPSAPARFDPNLTVLPAISAPVDEGVLIPKPPRSLWDKLLLGGGLVLFALAVLAFAFFHANPMR